MNFFSFYSENLWTKQQFQLKNYKRILLALISKKNNEIFRNFILLSQVFFFS